MSTTPVQGQGATVAVFDVDTRVERVSDSSFTGFVDKGWSISGNPNGGYLLSLISSAIAEVLPHPDPLTFTAHYLRPGAEGKPCEIEVDVVRTGRTLSTVRARLIQEGKARVEVIAAYADLSVSAGVHANITEPAPDMPPPEECIPRTGDLQGIDIAMTKKLDVRLHPDHAIPGGAGVPEVSGWIRFTDDRPIDTRALLLFCDTFPPSPFGQLGVVGWVPTIELTIHVRRRPSPGWIKGRFRTDDLEQGRMIESGTLWDQDNHLVAISRQVGLVLNQT